MVHGRQGRVSLGTSTISSSLPNGPKTRANQAIFIFVAIDQMGRPIEIPQVEAETEEEKERYDAALRRKQLSLILAGKMKPKDAYELKALFE